MDIASLVNLTSRAWAAPILAALHDGTPGRQAALLKATGAGRSSFAQSMEHLIALGLVERNPGHGHPLRPEFRLTPPGAEAADLASRVHQAAGADGRDLLRRAWTLPVLAVLKAPGRFNEIKRSLPGITDRALSQSLKALEGREWVHRGICPDSRPPSSLYSAINAGRVISGIAGAEVAFPGG